MWQLRGVLDQPAVAHLHMYELALDHPERVFDLGPNARLACSGLSMIAPIGEFLSSTLRLPDCYVPVELGPLRLFPPAHSAMSDSASSIAGPERLNHCYMNEVDALHGLTADGGCQHLVPRWHVLRNQQQICPAHGTNRFISLGTRAHPCSWSCARICRAEARLFHVLSVSHQARDAEVLQIFLNLKTLQQFVSADSAAGCLFPSFFN